MDRPQHRLASLNALSSSSPLLPTESHSIESDSSTTTTSERPSFSRAQSERRTSSSRTQSPEHQTAKVVQDQESLYPQLQPKEVQPWHNSITLGLVIHSLADGISLGASALASAAVDGVNLSIVVFLAILVSL